MLIGQETVVSGNFPGICWGTACGRASNTLMPVAIRIVLHTYHGFDWHAFDIRSTFLGTGCKAYASNLSLLLLYGAGNAAGDILAAHATS